MAKNVLCCIKCNVLNKIIFECKVLLGTHILFKMYNKLKIIY